MKEATLIFFGSWKFAATFPIAIFGMKMSFAETLVYINLGGIAGVIIFTKFWKVIIKTWNYLVARWIKSSNKKKIKFTKQKRRIVKLKSRYGLPGIVILNPVILSIPLSSFLVAKYYGNKTTNLVWLVIGQIAWSLIYTLFYFQIYYLI